MLATSALVLSVYCLNHAPDPAMVARWWPATTLITVMLILAPHHARPLAGLAAALIFAATLYAGHDIAFAIGFAIANAVEAMLVLRWLTGFEEERPQLRSWSDFRRWLIGLTVASLAAGAITAMTIGITGGDDLWRPLLWVAITHLGAQMVVLPLVMVHPRQKLKVSAVEVVSHVVLLGVGAYVCFEADQSQPVGFVLLPLLMWGAARFTPRWANLELLGVSVGIAVLTALERGPFREITAAGFRPDHRGQRADLRGRQRGHLRGVLRRDGAPARLPAADPRERAAARPARRLRQWHRLHRHRPRRTDHLVQPGCGTAARLHRRGGGRAADADPLPREP